MKPQQSKWLWVEAINIWRCEPLKQLDFNSKDVRYDPISQGYWVRADSNTAIIWALKGVEFGDRWGSAIKEYISEINV